MYRNSRKLLSSSQKIIFKSYPGFKQILHDEIQYICHNPYNPQITKKIKPIIHKYNINRFLDKTEIVVTCDFRLACELAIRLTTAEEARLILYQKRFYNVIELDRHLHTKVDNNLHSHLWLSEYLGNNDHPLYFNIPRYPNSNNTVRHKIKNIVLEYFQQEKMRNIYSRDEDGNWKLTRKAPNAPLSNETYFNKNKNNIVNNDNSSNLMNIDSIDFRLWKDSVLMSICLKGSELYRRGYKALYRDTVAPMQEHVAACCIKSLLKVMRKNRICDWRADMKKVLVLNPMAGTGTLGFEAVIAMMEPHPNNLLFTTGISEDNDDKDDDNDNGDDDGSKIDSNEMWAYERFLGEDDKTVQYLRNRSINDAINGSSSSGGGGRSMYVHMSDVNEGAATNIGLNVSKFMKYFYSNPSHKTEYEKESEINNGLTIETAQLDFLIKSNLASTIPKEVRQHCDSLLILLNPPRGKRLGKETKQGAMLIDFYKKIAKRVANTHNEFKQDIQGGMIICPDEDTWSTFRNTLLLKIKGKLVENTSGFTIGRDHMRLFCWGLRKSDESSNSSNNKSSSSSSSSSSSTDMVTDNDSDKF